MSALEQRTKKQRAAPPQRDKRNAGEDTLDDNTEDEDDATTPALAVELRTDGYRVAALLQPAPPVEAKRARGQQKPPQKPPPAFGEVRPYGTAAATALLSAIDKRVLPRALAPGLAGVVRLRIVDRRPGGGGPREVACRVGDDAKAAAEPIARPPRPLGAPAPRRSLADALDDDGGDDSDDSDDAPAEIVVAEPPRRDVVSEADEPEEEAEEASVAALRARLAVMVDVARAHGMAT